MEDARSFATNVVAAAIALIGIALLAAAAAFLFLRGSLFLALLAGLFGLVVLVAAGAFLLVPTKVDEIADTQSVRLKDEGQ